MSAAVSPGRAMTGKSGRSGSKPKRHYGTHIFLTAMAVMWLIPLVWAVFTALRPIASTNEHGYFSLAGVPPGAVTAEVWRGGVLVAIHSEPRAADALAVLHSYGGGNAAIGAWSGRV